MPVLPKSAWDIKLPEMVNVRQLFPDEYIKDIPAKVREELSADRISSRIKSGQTVAVLVGSRGIANISIIVKSVIDCLIEAGTKPFIVPAMGSHGGGLAEKQREIIEGYGITEEAMGVPIKASMDTVIIGQTPSGVDVHMDKNAYYADAVVPVARVKPHTDFRGPIESGLCKMLAIGCGKHNGCSTLHREGFDNFHELIPAVARVFIENKNIAFGLAIVENAHEHTHTIKAVPGNRFHDEEPALLELAKSLMPRLQFDELDVLVVEKIGKDITGSGMDPNIMGRLSYGPAPGYNGPNIKRIVVLGLTEATHGNATGIGVADFTVKSLAASVDWEATYANSIAACDPVGGFLPVVLDTEEEALRAAVQTCLHIDKNDARIVRIKNTLELTDIQVSSNLLPLCVHDPRFAVNTKK